MIRRLFTMVSVLSLLLCVAAAGMWLASYRRPGQWASGSIPGVRWEIVSEKGWLTVDRWEVLFLPNFRGRAVWPLESKSEPGARNSSGVFVARHHGIVRARLPGEERPPSMAIMARRPATPWCYQLRVGVAYPLVCLLSAVLPAVWLWRARGRRRQRYIGPGFEPVTTTAAALPPAVDANARH